MLTEKQSLLVQILEKGIEAVKKPLVIKRITRAFDSAEDSIEEQLMDKEAALNIAREQLVKAAKSGENIKCYMQSLIDIRIDIATLKDFQKALEVEKETLL